MVKETIASELAREGIKLRKDERRRIRAAIRTLDFRRKILERLIQKEAKAHRNPKTGTWDTRENQRKVAELAELRGNFQSRISRLGGGRRGANRASELYH